MNWITSLRWRKHFARLLLLYPINYLRSMYEIRWIWTQTDKRYNNEECECVWVWNLFRFPYFMLYPCDKNWYLLELRLTIVTHYLTGKGAKVFVHALLMVLSLKLFLDNGQAHVVINVVWQSPERIIENILAPFSSTIKVNCFLICI